MATPPDALGGDPLYHWKELRALRPEVLLFDASTKQAVANRLEHCDLIVDGLLGTGAKGEPRGAVRELIDLIVAARRPTLAIDMPSGLDSDSGQPASACVRADLTVTMALPKSGLLQQSALDYVGRLSVVDIGIPRSFCDALVGPEYFVREDARSLLPMRRPSAHKGDFGHVLALAGSEGYSGAPVLCTSAAMRTGAGLVTLGVPRTIWSVVASQCREVMPRAFDDLSPAAIAPWLERCNSIAAGPGLGQSAAVESLVSWLLQNSTHPLVLDADALNVLAKNPAQLKAARGPVILTPHPGEMGRLTGKTSREVQADRWSVSAEFAREFNVVLILKGARTVIAGPGGELSINSTGNAGMASGGMGDVLTGILAGLLAQGLRSFDAARLGVWLHGFGGDLAAQQASEESLIASDITANLGAAFRSLHEPGRQ